MHVFQRSIPTMFAAMALASAPSAHAFSIYFVGGDDCPYHDIQSAVDAAAQDPDVQDYVWLSNTGTYDDQHVVLRDANIIMEGGFHSCASVEPDDALTRINGTDGHSVFEFEGATNMILSNVFLTGASMGEDNRGGGIFFGGSGYLELSNVTVGANTAGYGGGIDVSPDAGSSSTLQLDANVQIINNTALRSGGGIRLEGNATLVADQPQTWILFNEAPNGYGGGLEVVGPAKANIGSPGFNGSAVIDGNSAQYGGGADVIATSDGNAELNLYSTDPSQPTAIMDNVATSTGGAVYLKSWAEVGIGNDNYAYLCARDFRIEGNSAQEGAAAYAESDYTTGGSAGSYIDLNYECSSAPQSVGCTPGIPCNRIADNVAQQADGTPTDGSTILLQTGGGLYADRVDFRGNTGGHVIEMVADGPGLFGTGVGTSLTNSLLVDNTVSHELVAAIEGDDGYFTIRTTTIAHNTIGAPYVLSLPLNEENTGRLILTSIIDQPGVSTLDPPESNPEDASDVLTTDISTLPDSDNVVLGEPTFVDVTHGDYHLAANSLGIDFAPPQSGLPHDLDGAPRVVDLPQADVFGPMDLGAYETQLDTVLACATGDTVFCDGFEL